MTNYAENREIMRVITQAAATADAWMITDPTGKGAALTTGINALMASSPAGTPSSIGPQNNAMYFSNGTGVPVAISLAADTFSGRLASAIPNGLTAANARTILDIVGITKAATESKTNDTTLADDDALVLALSASLKYKVVMFARVISHTTPNFKWAFSGPAGSKAMIWITWVERTFRDAQFDFYTDLVGSPGRTVNIATTGTNYFFIMTGVVFMGATAGDFSFQWAQGTSSANVTKVLSDSWLHGEAFD